MSMITQKFTPCLWFNGNALDAAKFYCSVFPDSKITNTSYYGPNMHMPEGTVLLVEFELDGEKFSALNGGPEFKFSEAISLMVSCKDQAEIDAYWKKLTADGGAEVQCGWLKDKYGLSWQIVPENLSQLLSGDRAKVNRVMQAVMKMVKLDIAEMQRAAENQEKAA